MTTMTIGALPARVNLQLYQGDDFTFTVAVTDFSLVGAAAEAQLRAAPGAAVLATFTVTVNESAGTLSLWLPAADTAGLPPGAASWDLQVISGGLVRTLLGGSVKVTAEVTI